MTRETTEPTGPSESSRSLESSASSGLSGTSAAPEGAPAELSAAREPVQRLEPPDSVEPPEPLDPLEPLEPLESGMSAQPPADRPPVPRATNTVKVIVYLIVSLPLRLVQCLLPATLILLGFATTMIGIGIPLLMAGSSLLRVLTDVERRWVRRMLDVTIPAPEAPVVAGGGMQRAWQARLVDGATWRELGYVLAILPIGIVDVILGFMSLVPPFAVWVTPWIGALHADFALRMLGPNRRRALALRAARLQASRARGVDAVETERRRLERDLHDGAQQRLVAVAMTLGRAQGKLAGGEPEDEADSLGKLIAEAHRDAKMAVSELRDLARGIYPAVLGDRGLDAALSAQAAKSPVPVDVEVDIDPRPPSAVETTAYFIVGEALTNVAKSSGATRARVRAWRDGEAVVVEVTDNGRGGATVRPGGGLAGLADRAVMIDGTLSVDSPEGGPTVIRAELPCDW